MPALSGLATHFHSALNDTYLAGIWKNDVIRGLNWNFTTAPGQYLEEANFPKASYIAPSWSWASAANLSIRFLPFPNQTDADVILESKAKLVDYGIENATADQHGKVRGGYVVLRGSYLPIADPSTIDPDTASTLLASVAYTATNNENKRDEFRVRHEPRASQEFGLLHLCTMADSFGKLPIRTASLLLVETTEDGQSYRRVGLHTLRLGGSLDPKEDEPHVRDFRAAKWVRRDISLI